MRTDNGPANDRTGTPSINIAKSTAQTSNAADIIGHRASAR
jgi:hypothetical protein